MPNLPSIVLERFENFSRTKNEKQGQGGPTKSVPRWSSSTSKLGSRMAGKQYGLILPKSKGGGAPSKPAGRGQGVASAFGEDDSSSSGTYLN